MQIICALQIIPRPIIFPTKARKDAQRISKALMVASCDFFLKGNKEAGKYISEEYVRTLLGDVIDNVEWFEK